MPFGPAHAGAVTARAARALQSGSMHQAHEGGPPFTTGRCLAMIIPHHMLSPEALHSVIEADVHPSSHGLSPRLFVSYGLFAVEFVVTTFCHFFLCFWIFPLLS